jgi:enterochelin esterase-like enzyme
MKFCILIALAGVGVLFAEDATPLPDGVKIVTNGRFRIIKNFPSDVFRNTRTLFVYLPPSYDSNTSAVYPIAFFNDGTGVFHFQSPNESWDADITADRLVREGRIRECILVGVSTANRGEEYGLDRSKDYRDLLIGEILPFLTSHYRIARGPSNTAIIGSSAGGANAFHIAWNHPDDFGLAGCLSTSFWWNEHAFLKMVENGEKKPVRFWIDSGGIEFEDRDGSGISSFVEDSMDVVSAMLALGWINGTDLMFRVDPKAAHRVASWRDRLPETLTFLFGIGKTARMTNLAPVFSTRLLDRKGNLPYAALYVQAAYDNGVTGTVLPELCRIVSSDSNGFRIRDNRLSLLPGASGSRIDLRVSYAGLEAPASLEVADGDSGEVLLTVQAEAPLDSPDVIYATGGAKVLGRWQPDLALPLYLAGKSETSRFYTNTVSVKRNTFSEWKLLSGPDSRYCEVASWYDPDGTRHEGAGSMFFRAEDDTNVIRGKVGRWLDTPR